MKTITTLFTTYLLLLTAIASSAVADNKTETITTGWLEGVLLQPGNIRMRAKLDTGAKTSSLHALEIERFERDGEQWVRFNTGPHSKKSQMKPIESPLIREVKIKDHLLNPTIRPVIEMTFCMHNQLFTGEFSLVDRSPFNYPMLLGRRLLEQGVIIDPSKTFTVKTSENTCSQILASSQEVSHSISPNTEK